MNAARDAFERLGGNLLESYAEIVPPQLAHLAVELERLNNISVLNELDRAIARGANLDLIWPRWALWLFDEELKEFETSAPIAALFRRVIVSDLPKRMEWEKVRSASIVKVSASASAAASRRIAAADAAMSAANAYVDVDSASWVAWRASSILGGKRTAKKLKHLLATSNKGK